jgi:RimJ/RimL family protein N-acetyltransferase
MSRAIITLRPLTRADLGAITPWFEDPDTRRSLGGSDWPAAMLDRGERAVGEMFRGAVQTGAHHYLAETNGRAVGYIDCGTFDCCTVYGGEGPDGPIILETIEAATGSIAFVIDPAHRRDGLATSMIQALTRHPDLAAVELFEAGVDPENHGSRRALEAAGFRLQSAVPDCEAMLYYRAWTSHAATLAPITIEVLYFDGCPNQEKLVTHLPQLLEREGITAEIVLRDIPDTKSAIQERFLGSPTVRLNGHDIDPDASQRDDYGLKCRLYRTPSGLSGLPPDQWIIDAIAVHRAVRTRALD